ncbi:MAG: hypothetical protein KME40_32405 [Komarekiella atlantica HA4396-MV6]|jgi:hypothetical protein|nr:hypothetical protein [Komarekiella atlantica HA4396-MV6]
MVRKGELTVQGTEVQTSIESQSRKIIKGTEQKLVPVPSAFSLMIEQLEIAFDDDLRLAIFERLVREQQQIAQQATQEEKVTKAFEIARLEAIEQAKEKGKQSARKEIAQRKTEKLAAIRKQFIDVDLEKLIDSCDYLPYETMKQTIDGFAAQVGVKLEWKDLDDGKFECTPSIA